MKFGKIFDHSPVINFIVQLTEGAMVTELLSEMSLYCWPFLVSILYMYVFTVSFIC